MRMQIGCLAAALAAGFVHAGSLEVYKSIDSAGRVSYTNQKPRQGDFDVVMIEYDAPVPSPLAPKAVMPTIRPAAHPDAAPRAATLRVVAFPSLRLASITPDAPARARRKAMAVASPAWRLRLDTELRGFLP